MTDEPQIDPAECAEKVKGEYGDLAPEYVRVREETAEMIGEDDRAAALAKVRADLQADGGESV